MGTTVDLGAIALWVCITAGIMISLFQNERNRTELKNLKQQYQHDLEILKDDCHNKIALLEQKYQNAADKQE